MGGQDAIILGGARLKDGLSMTFGLTWRFRSRPSSGGDQMKATVCATYPASLTQSCPRSRTILAASETRGRR